MIKNEKFIVKVIRKRIIEVEQTDGIKQRNIEEVDQIFEQEFEKFDMKKFVVNLNVDREEKKDEKSLKLAEDGRAVKG